MTACVALCYQMETINGFCTLDAETLATKCNAVANKLIAPNVFIDYRSFCRAASVSVSSVQEP